MEIWDTAGNEKYRAVMENQLKNADIIFLMFDVNIPKTFYNLEDYFKNISKIIKKPALICVLGNKADIQKGKFDIEFNKKIYKFVKENSFYYAETSIYHEDDIKYNEIVFFDGSLYEETVIKTVTSSGYLIYNPIIEDDNKAQRDSNLFENKTYFNAGINVILDLVINENFNRKKKLSRKSSNNPIKITSNKVNTRCSCRTN